MVISCLALEPEEGNSHFQMCVVSARRWSYTVSLSATVMSMTIALILQPENYSSDR